MENKPPGTAAILRQYESPKEKIQLGSAGRTYLFQVEYLIRNWLRSNSRAIDHSRIDREVVLTSSASNSCSKRGHIQPLLSAGGQGAVQLHSAFPRHSTSHQTPPPDQQRWFAQSVRSCLSQRLWQPQGSRRRVRCTMARLQELQRRQTRQRPQPP
jgi:hypothetical protein